MDLKICILPYRANASGLATYSIELARALASANVETYMVTFGLNPPLRLGLEEAGVNIVEVSSRDPVELEWLGPLVAYSLISKKLQATIDRDKHLRNVDVFHFVIPPAMIRVKQGSNMVATAWSDLSLIAALNKVAGYFQFPLNLLSIPATLEYYLCNRLAFTKARKIVCGTKSVLNFVGSRYPNKAIYLPPPIESHVKRIPKKTSSKPVLLFVARSLDIPRKNVMAFLNAILLLAKKGTKEFRVKLVGFFSNNMKRLVEKIYCKTGVEIEMLGYVSRLIMPKVFLSSDVFVYPSLYEDMSYAVLEAMSYGLPVVVSDVPAFRDLTEGGKNGFLVQARDYVKMADTLKLLVEDGVLRERLGQQSLRIIAEKHSYKAVAERALNVYHHECYQNA